MLQKVVEHLCKIELMSINNVIGSCKVEKNLVIDALNRVGVSLDTDELYVVLYDNCSKYMPRTGKAATIGRYTSGPKIFAIALYQNKRDVSAMASTMMHELRHIHQYQNWSEDMFDGVKIPWADRAEEIDAKRFERITSNQDLWWELDKLITGLM